MQELLANIDPMIKNAIIGVVALGLLDWILGVIRALADKTFKIEYLDVWVRTQLLGRILPIVLVLAFSTVFGTISVGDVGVNLLQVAGLGAAAAYAAVTIKSIIDSLNRGTPDKTPTE